MKSKKILILATMFLLIMLLMIAMPQNVLATNNEILDETGKLVVDSIKPTSYEEFYDYISHYLMSTIDGIEGAYPSNQNSDYTVCDINIMYKDGTVVTKQNVNIEYKVGEDSIKTKIDNFAKEIPKEKTFNLNDLEIIN